MPNWRSYSSEFKDFDFGNGNGSTMGIDRRSGFVEICGM